MRTLLDYDEEALQRYIQLRNTIGERRPVKSVLILTGLVASASKNPVKAILKRCPRCDLFMDPNTYDRENFQRNSRVSDLLRSLAR